jgi:hypothetical protein
MLGSIRPKVLFTKRLRYYHSAMHIFRGIRCCILLPRSTFPTFGCWRGGLISGNTSTFVSVATKYMFAKQMAM